MQALYPDIKPFAEHQLSVDDIHKLHIEECGRIDGIPVLFLHGGPGGGTEPYNRRFFNPEKYRIILFDQRGCGKSKPHGCLENNTTQDLIDDIEKIREHLGVDKWVLFGGSWGATLALLYAQDFPERVSGMILRGVFLARRKDLTWLYQEGANRVFPDAWEDFIKPIPEAERGDLLEAYNKRLNSDNEIVRMSACKAWSTWEGNCATLKPNSKVMDHFTDPHTAVSLARIEVHYFLKNTFIEENRILNNMERIQDIPGIIVHGRYDMVCPLDNSQILYRNWANAELNIIREAGHSSSEAAISDALVKATNKMADFMEEDTE
ncbi:MAG: prolyl aminopeptidase [Ketobacteraceae bacterium]|nr:prolyl aminopeptidase [Ketobacteraceae bacterium]